MWVKQMQVDDPRPYIKPINDSYSIHSIQYSQDQLKMSWAKW